MSPKKRAQRRDEQKKQGIGKEKGNGMPKKSGDKVKGDCHASNGFNRSTGLRNWCCKRENAYHRNTHGAMCPGWKSARPPPSTERLVGHPTPPSP